MTALETIETKPKNHAENTREKSQPAIEYAKQASRLGQYQTDQEDDGTGSTQATEAMFITAQDPVIETVGGGRLPAVPLEEAQRLNELKDKLEDRDPREMPVNRSMREAKDGTIHGVGIHGVLPKKWGRMGAKKYSQSTAPEAPLRQALPPSKTNPLFPPLPMYGPPTLLREVQCLIFRFCSCILSLFFLGTIVAGSLFTYIPLMLHYLGYYVRLQHPDMGRPFYEEEKRRAQARRGAEAEWLCRKTKPGDAQQVNDAGAVSDEERNIHGTTAPYDAPDPIEERFVPTEGGKDLLICDVAYYARREGLDSETYIVQTEDGFIIELWHIYNPLTCTPKDAAARKSHSPQLSSDSAAEEIKSKGHGYGQQYPAGTKKYPVLLLHGLLQSSGAYACTGANSLAFYLAKAGYDVWLGNNRCGFNPQHTMLKHSDPRMWAWNIRHMGVMDLPALVSRVLTETGFEKCALVAHSQGTTQTLVALAKEQRPELGRKLSVVCLLAPAAYAGPLIGKAYFKFMRVISPALFRLVFGIHSFIPFMLAMHQLLPGQLYGFMGYRVFSFLFNWTDERWERELRNRCFMFAPVYVSSESMRWWLGRECFARQKCILATKRETRMEDAEDREEEEMEAVGQCISNGGGGEDAQKTDCDQGNGHQPVENGIAAFDTSDSAADVGLTEPKSERGRFAWYDDNAPPMAFWVAGADDLVDGRRLLRRFARGREPFVNVVHEKVVDGYEHLDVIWAVDSLEQVGKEVGEVVWKTVGEEERKVCRVPRLELD